MWPVVDVPAFDTLPPPVGTYATHVVPSLRGKFPLPIAAAFGSAAADVAADAALFDADSAAACADDRACSDVDAAAVAWSDATCADDRACRDVEEAAIAVDAAADADNADACALDRACKDVDAAF